MFDYGNVLSGPPNQQAWQSMLGTSGIADAEFHRAYWLHRDDYDDGTLDANAYWQAVAASGGFPLDSQRADDLKSADVLLWTDPNEPMRAWVRQVHDAGRVSTGILSNIGDAMAEGIRARFDWIGRFDHAVWSHALRMRKPAPAIYRAAADGLGVPAEAVLFIDDKQENIRGAEAVGMTGVVYADHDQFLAEIRDRGFGWLTQAAQASV